MSRRYGFRWSRRLAGWGGRLAGWGGRLGRHLIIALAAGTAALPMFVAPPTASAQELDRTKPPAPGPSPAVRAPVIAKRTLSNGLRVWVVTQRELPIVNAVMVIRSGSALDGANPGVAEMTADLLDEGTESRSALEFATAVDQIGASLGAAAGDEQTQVSLLTLTRHLDSALALMGEMVVQPAFRGEEVERERKARLQALQQQKDLPGVIASQVFMEVVYGESHPYGHSAAGTLESVAKLDTADLGRFYGRYYRPNNSILIVVGDVTADGIVPKLQRAFQGWERAPIPADAAAVPARPPAHRTAVFLIDKPEAAQSEIRIGHAGVPRSATPDYYALQVLNTALGGAFTSRINLNLREAKGYTYGARTGWEFNRGPGPFVASAGVFTAKTDSSLIEFMRELRGIRQGRLITREETAFAKASLVRAYPRRLETAGGIAQVLADIAFFDLPDSEITAYLAKVRKVQPADVTRVARKYLRPDRATIVVVGDLAKIKPTIDALDLGPVRVLDTDGEPVVN